jgi:hypothetical protein
MDDILETYALAYDQEIPLICMDEQPVQLLDHSRHPQRMKPGQVQKEDYESIRKEAAACLCSQSRSLGGITCRLRKGAPNPIGLYRYKNC